jgi:L-arabinonolactonase
MESKIMTAAASLLIDARNQLGECVLWCERAQCVWWTDIMGCTLWRHSPATGITLSWLMPERLASFALTSTDDVLLLGLASRLAYFDCSSGSFTAICTVEPELPSTRVNDGRCDRQGRFVFGTCNEALGQAPIGSFYRLNADLSLERLALGPVSISNSICFSPDGHTMYYCDSLTKTIRCCTYGPSGGAVSDDKLFADLQREPGVPDGSLVDADGYLWNAQWGGARVVRYAPDGNVDRVLPLPVSQPSCVAFGGAGLNELYISSARVSMSADALAQEPQAGGLFHYSLPGAAGLPESRFSGIPPTGNVC